MRRLIRKDTLYGVLIALVIVIYGILGPRIWPIYQGWIESFLPTDYLTKLTKYFTGIKLQNKDINNLGIYLLYYPSYIILHLGLVSVLFRGKPKSRSVGILIVLIGIPLLALSCLIFYQLNWIALYKPSTAIFKTLVELPFILFVVEGGRILDADIDRLLKSKS